MQKSSRKTKVSPNAEEIEAEYYTAQKSKISKGKSSKKVDEFDENKENENVGEKVQIKLSTKKTVKKPLGNQREETSEKDEIEEVKVDLSKKAGFDLEAVKRNHKKETLEFTEILESKYIPSVFLYRDKERNDILGFITK